MLAVGTGESWMKYGKIRIEDGYLVFTKHMMMNNLPCKDILWAYMRREGMDGVEGRQLINNYLVIVTRRKKRYQFDMTEREVQDCIRLLKVLNPEMAVGYPKGGRVPLQSLENTRDLGAIATSDDKHIIPRKLLRSGDLYHLSMADQRVLLEEYNLKKVIDFRTSAEMRERPDTIMAGVEYYHIPILDEETIGVIRTEKLTEALEAYEGDSREFMEKQYENIIRDQYSIKQYARFLDVILHHQNGAVLWHCSAGKDRAGIATALLLCVLGVSRKGIREDFMKTNVYLEGERKYMERLLLSRSGDNSRKAENLKLYFTVDESYINCVFNTIEKTYGSIQNFLKKGLYLTPKAIEDLKEKYLI